MAFFSPLKKTFLDSHESANIIAAIRQAESRTSGEVRVFIESRCKYVDPVDRAAEVFIKLEMAKTENHNAVLIYVAAKDRQAAVYGDEGIYKKTGKEFWEKEVVQMMGHFKTGSYASGIGLVINDIGEALHYHFPYDRDTDKNELPDDIVFGQ